MALQRSKENLQRSEERIAQNNANRANTGTISANELVETPKALNMTPVEPDPLPSGKAVDGVLGSIRSMSDTAKQLEESRANFGTFADQSSGFDIQNQQLERFGVTPDKLKRLGDIELQLADRNTESNITKSRIGAAAGQTSGQAQREVTQENREEAIRSAGLAAEAAVLQGNIETGRSLARDAVTIALADRDFKAKAMLQNIQDLKEVANEETRQLLVKEERKYTEERETVKEIKQTVEAAMVSGIASSEQIQLMTSPETPDDVRLSTARSLVAQRANQDYSLERAIKGRQYEKLGLEIDSVNARIVAAAKAAESGVLTEEQFKVANDLRKEVNGLQEVKDAKDLEANTASLIAALEQENGVGDISAINSFQRLVVDPGVAVREGDVALLQSAQSFTDEATLKAQGLWKGDKLTPQARVQMKSLVEDVYRIRTELVGNNTQQVRTIAQEQGIDYGKYVGKNFQTFDQLKAKAVQAEAVEFGLPTDTESYLDNIVSTIGTNPAANPFGVTLE